MQAPATPAGHWFDGRSLARLTDPGTWERGFALYVSQHVLALQERKAALADSMYSGAAALRRANSRCLRKTIWRNCCGRCRAL